MCVPSPDYLAGVSYSDAKVSSRLSKAVSTTLIMLGHEADGSVADDQTYDDREADEEKYGYLRDELGEIPS